VGLGLTAAAQGNQGVRVFPAAVQVAAAAVEVLAPVAAARDPPVVVREAVAEAEQVQVWVAEAPLVEALVPVVAARYLAAAAQAGAWVVILVFLP